MSRVVIVGTGAAGWAVAEGLTVGKFDGEVILIGEETEDPYDRPPLSKEILSGTWEPPRAALIAAKRSAPLNPTVHTGVAATSVDAAARTVSLSDGASLSYDHLVVATGITPRRIPAPDLPNVHVLRTMQHSLALHRQLLTGNPRLLVVGAGFLGLEVAATARKLGATVTMVEPIPGPPLANKIGAVAAQRLLANHQRNGVTIHTGVGVAELNTDGSIVRATLADGVDVDADVVLIAVGSAPTTGFLDGSGLTVENGLVCDEFCHAGHNVWGAGDVASWHHVGYEQRMRLEHRTNAQEQGHHVAKNILGANAPFTPIPYFWTDQYDFRIQLAGVIPLGVDGEIVEGAPDDDFFVQTYTVGGDLVGALVWNAPRKLAEYRQNLVARAI